MEKNIKTGDFIISEDQNKPIILMVFNLFETDVENVTYKLKDNYIYFYYKSGNILKIEVDNENLKKKIEELKSILIMEVNQDKGDIEKMYITNKKPA